MSDLTMQGKQNKKRTSKFEGMGMYMDEEERGSQKSKVLIPRGILGQKYKMR